MAKKISSEQRKQVVSMLLHGFRDYDIVERVGVSMTTIHNIKNERGITHDVRMGRTTDSRVTKEDIKAIDTIYAIIVGG